MERTRGVQGRRRLPRAERRLDVIDPAQRPRTDPGSRRARRRRLGRHQVPAGVLLQPRVLAVSARRAAEREGRGAGHRALLDRARPRRGHGGVRSGQGGGRGRVRGRRPEGHRVRQCPTAERGEVRRHVGRRTRGESRAAAADELEEGARDARAPGRRVHHRVHRARRGVRRGSHVHVRRRAPRRRRRRRERLRRGRWREAARQHQGFNRETNRRGEGAVRGVAGRRGERTRRACGWVEHRARLPPRHDPA